MRFCHLYKPAQIGLTFWQPLNHRIINIIVNNEVNVVMSYFRGRKFIYFTKIRDLSNTITMENVAQFPALGMSLAQNF